MRPLFRDYMLLPTNDSGRDEMRERLLTDPTLFDEFREQENEWIDACAAGRLNPQDAALLHRHLRETGQLHRLGTAAALAAPPPARPIGIFPVAFAIAAMAGIVFMAVLSSEHRKQELAVNVPPPYAVPLNPGTLRDGSSIPRIARSDSQGIVLELQYQDTTPTGDCIATLRDSSGKSIESAEDKCGLDFHRFPINSHPQPGRYTVELATPAGEIIHVYAFDVTRERRTPD